MPDLPSLRVTIQGIDLKGHVAAHIMTKLRRRMDVALQRAADEVIFWNEVMVQNWEMIPKFEKQPIQDQQQTDKELLVTTDDKIWKWVSKGTDPVTISMQGSDHYMRFRFQGRGNSYEAKTPAAGMYGAEHASYSRPEGSLPFVPATASFDARRQKGWLSKFDLIRDRSIAPRYFGGSVLLEYGDEIMQKMREVIEA